MKKILIPTDFSEQAESALQVGILIAKQTGAEIHLLHIEEFVNGTGFSAMGDAAAAQTNQLFMVKLMEVNKRKIVELIDRISPQTEGLTIVHQVDIGQMFKIVRDYIKENAIDLVVMGTHGSSGFSEVLIGSNTEKVVRHAGCPVLSVRQLPDNFSLKKMVFATNFDGDQEKVVSQLKQMQALFGSHIYLLYVNTLFSFTSTRRIREKMEAFVKQHQLTEYEFHAYSDETEERGIIHFSDEVEADVIAVATHGRTGLSHLLLGSIAEDIVNHAQRPVLTFHLS